MYNSPIIKINNMKNYFDLRTEEGLKNTKAILEAINPLTPYITLINFVKDLSDKTLSAVERNKMQLEASEEIIRKCKDMGVKEAIIEVDNNLGIKVALDAKKMPDINIGSSGKTTIIIKF